MNAEVGPSRRVTRCQALSGGCRHCCRVVIAAQYAAAEHVGRLIRGSLGLAVLSRASVAVGLLALKGAVRGCYGMTQSAKNDEPRSREGRLHDTMPHATHMPSPLRISRRQGGRSEASKLTCASIWQTHRSAAQIGPTRQRVYSQHFRRRLCHSFES